MLFWITVIISLTAATTAAYLAHQKFNKPIETKNHYAKSKPHKLDESYLIGCIGTKNMKEYKCVSYKPRK